MGAEMKQSGKWYVLRAREGREEAAADLLVKKCRDGLLDSCRVLKKCQLLRSGGRFYPIERLLFPGYVLVQTADPEGLCELVLRSREFPQPGEDGSIQKRPVMIPVEQEDMEFLQSVCGPRLSHEMGISRVHVDENRCITDAKGAIVPYLDRIRKVNLHKRYALVEVPLFQRSETILFPIELEQDRNIIEGYRGQCKETEKRNKQGEAKMKKFAKSGEDELEICVCCHKKLDIPVSAPIEFRDFYVEGAGQLCYDCYQEIYGRTGKK